MLSLSVIIPAYNEEKDISEAIKSLRSQSLKPKEIIIVDDGSTDATIKIAKSLGAKIARQNHQGPGLARNLGAKIASGDILIFVDADMTFHKDYLKNLVKPLIKDSNLIGTTHDLEIVKNTKNIWSACWGSIRVSKAEAREVKIFRAIRRIKFLELGGFDSKYGYADDQTFWFKHKIKPVVAENTTCYHKNPETLKSVYKQSAWIGASIDNKLLNLPIIKYLSPILIILLSIIFIPLITLKKLIHFKKLRLILAMPVFITVRYFGTVKGIINKIYFNKNFR